MKSKAYQGFEVASTSWKMTGKMILFLFIAIWVVYSVGFYYFAPIVWPKYFHPVVVQTVKYWFIALWKAFLGLGLQLHKKYMVWTDGQVRSVQWVFDHINGWAWFCRMGVRYGFYLAVTEALLIVPGILYFRYKAAKINSPEHKRGAKLIKAKQLNRKLRKKYGQGDIPLSKEIVLPYDLENRHVFLVGGTGTGKTSILINVLQKLRQRGEKTVIFDIKGDFCSLFYNQDTDIIFNPLDQRTVRWTLFNDLVNSKAAKDMARSFVPPASGSDAAQFFHEAAKSLLAAILIILAKDRKTAKNKEIYKIMTLPLPKLQKFLSKHPEGLAAYSYIEKADSQQATGVKATLMQHAESFEDLQNIDGDFSFRRWIREDGPGFLFLPVPPQYRESLSPAMTTVVNILIQEMLGLADNLDRRRFFVLDELGALNKLPALIKGLTLGRSKGLSIWSGIQDFGQIDSIYGKEARETIWNNSVTKVILRVDSPYCAEYLAKSLGQSEMEESSHGHSMGVKDGKDGLNLSRQIHMRYAMLPSEIQAIPDLTAAVKVAGFDPAYPCQITRQKIEPTGAPAFDPLGLGEDDEIENDDSWVGIEEIELKEDENYEPEWLNEPESSEEISEPAPHDDPDVDSKLCELCQGPKQEQPEKTESEDEDMQTQTFHPL